MIDIAFAPMVLAAIACVILGWLWYGPYLFGAIWMQFSNFTPEQIEHGKRRMVFSALIGFLASVLVAFIMTYIGIAMGISNWLSAVELGAAAWAGFVVPVLLGSVLWDQRSLRLFLINASYWLVSFVLIALVLFFFSAFSGWPSASIPAPAANVQTQ